MQPLIVAQKSWEMSGHYLQERIDEAGFDFMMDTVLTREEIKKRIIPALLHRDSEIELIV